MREILYLTKRNSLVFLRDRKAVFFSILSMLIVLGLMVIFLGSMNSQNLVELLQQYGGKRDLAQDEENARALIQMWTLAGILVVNSVTVTLTVIGTMVQDEEQSRLASFYVTPVKRGKLVLGYVLAAWLTGAALSMLTLAVGEIYMLSQGWGLLPAPVLAAMCGMILLNTFVYASLGYLMAMLLITLYSLTIRFSSRFFPVIFRNTSSMEPCTISNPSSKSSVSFRMGIAIILSCRQILYRPFSEFSFHSCFNPSSFSFSSASVSGFAMIRSLSLEYFSFREKGVPNSLIFPASITAIWLHFAASSI